MRKIYKFKSLQILYKSIGRNTKDIRKKNGLTQSQLADKTALSHEYIRKLEAKQGKKSLSIGALYKISLALNVNIEDLVKPNKLTLEEDEN